MRLVADSGLWSTGRLVEPAPVVAVLEISGAVLSWTVDDGSGAAAITFTDLPRADWLWRILGEPGHTAVAAALAGRSPDEARAIDLTGIDMIEGSLDPLRRLALGHWLRRWWPASHRDGIAALDAALLDAELALVTASAQDFFTDDTFDSDVASLLRPHAVALGSLAREGDPRVTELMRACADLAADVGIAVADGGQQVEAGGRDDYALAAGADLAQRGAGEVARGVGSISWAAVPPGIFDAAENTVEWIIEAAGTAKAVVRAELSGTNSADGIAMRLRSGAVGGAGVLDANGRATFPLIGAHDLRVTESAAWDHDWRTTTVTIGADVDESAQTRERVRGFARRRLAEPAGDAFLAEILAAESDY